MRAARVPPDGGYGWVVVAGCALVNVFNQSLVSVFGLMFAEYLASLGEHAFGAALVMNVMNISLNFSGLITGPIIKQFNPPGMFLVVARSVMAEMRSLIPLMVTSAFYGIFRSITIVNQNLTVAEYCSERRIEKMLPNALGFNMYFFVAGAPYRERVMADNFDDLSNDQLRLKLLEFGFSNIPVTSTTRKVLIKKIRNQISSGIGPAGKAARRETIHNLAKYSSDEESESSGNKNIASKKVTPKKEVTNRRATIGGAGTKAFPKPVTPSQPTPKFTPAVGLPPEPVSASIRRSGRVTPVKEKNFGLASSQPNPKVSSIMEDSDSDDMFPLSQLNQSTDRTPSLSRAEMLTTSYVHQMEVPIQAPEEMEIDVPKAGRNTEQMDVIVIEDDDDDDDDGFVIPFSQKRAPGQESYNNLTSSDTGEMQPTISSNVTANKAADEFNFLEPTSLKYTSNTVQPPLPNVSYSASTSLPKPSSASTSVRNRMSSTVRDEGGLKFDPSKSPYLSEFTKRLSRLRAEARLPTRELIEPGGSPARRTITAGDSSSLRASFAPRETYEGSSSASRYRASARQTIAPMYSMETRGATAAAQRGMNIRSTMQTKLLALDKKFSIRTMFFSLIIILVVIFLFVLFFL
uniref:LEM domain-containing protein n=1 Tax=Anopheles farauti TaxID=69004 RepID=A0A182Q4D7_9DIPT